MNRFLDRVRLVAKAPGHRAQPPVDLDVQPFRHLFEERSERTARDPMSGEIVTDAADRAERYDVGAIQVQTCPSPVGRHPQVAGEAREQLGPAGWLPSKGHDEGLTVELRRSDLDQDLLLECAAGTDSDSEHRMEPAVSPLVCGSMFLQSHAGVIDENLAYSTECRSHRR
jgi:hypothetical protein